MYFPAHCVDVTNMSPIIVYPPLWRYIADIDVRGLAAPAKKAVNVSIPFVYTFHWQSVLSLCLLTCVCVCWFVYKYCLLMHCIIYNTNASDVCKIKITCLLIYCRYCSACMHNDTVILYSNYVRSARSILPAVSYIPTCRALINLGFACNRVEWFAVARLYKSSCT